MIPCLKTNEGFEICFYRIIKDINTWIEKWYNQKNWQFHKG